MLFPSIFPVIVGSPQPGPREGWGQRSCCLPVVVFSQACRLFFLHLVNNPLPHHNFLGICLLGLPVSCKRANKAAWPREATIILWPLPAPTAHTHSSPAFNLLLTSGV